MSVYTRLGTFQGSQNDSFQFFFGDNGIFCHLYYVRKYEKSECKFHLVLYMRRKRNLQLIKIRVKIVVMANVAVVHTKVERKYYLHRF